MRRMLLAVSLAMLIGTYAQLVGAQQTRNPLVGVWRGALANGNPVQISMASDGRAIEQTPQPGLLVTAYGRYSAQGNILTMVFTDVMPKRECGTTINADPRSETRCLATVLPPPITATFQFESPNELLWGLNTPPALHLYRVR